jgi:hypothetical protein
MDLEPSMERPAPSGFPAGSARRRSGRSATSRCSRIRRGWSRRARGRASWSIMPCQRVNISTSRSATCARFGLQLIGEDDLARAASMGMPRARATSCTWRTEASPRPRLGVLTMRSKARSSAGWETTRKIGHGIADFLALVKARAADDAVIQPSVTKRSSNSRIWNEARTRMAMSLSVALDLRLLDLLADGAGLFFESQAACTCTFVLGIGLLGEQGLAEPALIVGDQVEAAPRMCGGAVVALEPDDGGAGEILLEAQDVVDLGAAPAIDRLVVVADAADVGRSPAGRWASSRSHMYCAVLVSWYSSTRMKRNFCWYSASARPGWRGTCGSAGRADRRNRPRSGSSAAPGRPDRAPCPCRWQSRGCRPRGCRRGRSPCSSSRRSGWRTAGPASACRQCPRPG